MNRIICSIVLLLTSPLVSADVTDLMKPACNVVTGDVLYTNVDGYITMGRVAPINPKLVKLTGVVGLTGISGKLFVVPAHMLCASWFIVPQNN